MIMNKIIKQCVLRDSNIDIENCSVEELEKVTEINVSDSTMNKEFADWDFSMFPNLKKLDCSYVPISSLNISKNFNLESLRWEGVRGNMQAIDLSANKKLKKIRGGQDGLRELDLSSNTELEIIDITLSQDLRWINVDNCQKLKSITLNGVLIPMIDLTNCKELEYVDISYWNTYKNKGDEYGDGFPRPYIFVNHSFDENIICKETKQYSYYCYYLIKVEPNSKEEKALSVFKDKKCSFLDIKTDYHCISIAKNHYVLRELLKEIIG